MTRPSNGSLVLDGNQIKVRLEAERQASRSPVHVDWLRFTVQRRNVLPSVDTLFPQQHENQWTDASMNARFSALIAAVPDCEVAGASSISFSPFDRSVALEAYDLTKTVCEALGAEFSVAVEVRKGHDFYRYRWSIMRCEVECGWVGFLSSSSSPRQQAQNRTIHVNLYGQACTFGADGWREKIADLIDSAGGDITRVDLALDFFDGIPGGFDSVVRDYESGACNVNGKEPKCNQLGDWVHGHARSFYIGSKEAGKQTNVYEKGDQLFGVEAASPWHRVELRYGNKLRVLPSDALRRPADFFGGASDWHQSMLFKAEHQSQAQPIKCVERLQAQSVEAEVTRSLRWTLTTASASLATWLLHAPNEARRFLDLVSTTAVPGRLQRFTHSEISRAMGRALDRFHVAASPGQACVCV